MAAFDTQSIIDRVSKKAEPPAEEDTEGEIVPPDTSSASDVHFGEAFDALKSDNREAFISAMKACQSSGYTPPDV